MSLQLCYRSWVSIAWRFCLFYLFASGEAMKAKIRQRQERSNEYKIKRNLLKIYDQTTRPVRDDKTPITVNIAISLYHILDTNEKEQTFTCLLAIRQRWRDEYLTWNQTEFGGVETIRIPANKLWIPDLVISNFAGDKFNDYMLTNTIVSYDGTVLWLFPALIKTTCILNVKYFPFDNQQCDIVFISWTHSGDQLDVTYNSSFKNSVYYESKNQEWAVDGISAERHERKYACCKELYPDVTFSIHMRRGSLFYIVNLIAPCFLIFLISFLGFFLPVESGEKVNLETTILLALVVFLLMVGETMPPTPDAIPILGMFFASTMVMVTVALVMAVIVTNIYAKKDSSNRAPEWCIRIASKFYPNQFLPERSAPQGLSTTPASRRKVHDSSTSYRSATPEQLQACKRINRYTTAVDVDFAPPISEVNKDDEAVTTCCFCCAEYEQGDTSAYGGGGIQNSATKTDECDSDQERFEAEWRMLAKFTDRIFFWIFLGLSMSTHISLFMQMVPETRKLGMSDIVVN